MRSPLPGSLAAVFALALLASCSQRTHRLGIDLRPDSWVMVLVEGERASVHLRNLGPGAVHATIEATRDPTRLAHYDLERGALVAQGLSGPFRVTLETRDEPARIDFEAQGADGIAFDGVD